MASLDTNLLVRLLVADFPDCLHVGLCAAANREPLLTFDTKAARLGGARLLDG